MNVNDPHLLVVGDSATLETGFARVVQNLCARWTEHFKKIDLWGIGYNGCPHPLPYRIWPAAWATSRAYDWAGQLGKLLKLISVTDYTHIFIIQDPWHFSEEWSQAFSDLCRKRGIHTTFYCPVDAPMRRKWVSVLTHVDLPVAYCDYGREEIRKACGLTPRVLPHGTDTAVYHPLWKTVEQRNELRKRCFGDNLAPDEILILNVASHQKRKGLVNTLEIFARLLNANLPVKLMMHMEAINREDQTNLEMACEQLGIPSDRWFHSQNTFVEGGFSSISEKGLNDLYNCADVFLSTTYGEGWGLCITESAAAGVPHVFAPGHTSCVEIAETLGLRLLPTSESGVMLPLDRSRVRYGVDVRESARIISELLLEHRPARKLISAEHKEWMSWDRIAGEFLRMMIGKERL